MGVASNDQIKECGLLTFTLLFYKMLQNEQFLLFASDTFIYLNGHRVGFCFLVSTENTIWPSENFWKNPEAVKKSEQKKQLNSSKPIYQATPFEISQNHTNLEFLQPT